MELLNAFIYLINSTPAPVILSFLALLVSILGAYNSSRAIRLSQRAEKRSIESDINTKKLKSIEKQTEITMLLNEALMDVSHASTSLKLCKLSLPKLLDIYSTKIAGASQEEYRAEVERIIHDITKIEAECSDLETNIRKTHEQISKESELSELQKSLVYADAFRKTAAMEFQRAQDVYQDLIQGLEVVTKAIFKGKGFDL